MSLVDHDEIVRRLAEMPEWHHRGNALEKRFDRASFDGAIEFVNAVASLANLHDHHPDMTVSWNLVTLTLCSHDVGGITERDFLLANALDALVVEA